MKLSEWLFLLCVAMVGFMVALFLVAADLINPSFAPTPRETPRVWELPSGEGVCVLLGDTPIGCYQKGTP